VLTFLLGGVRSGKSTLAVRLASRHEQVAFIATAEAGDAEMRRRISRHRAERPTGWTTIEEPLDLLAALGAAPPAACLVIDCLTLWVSNLVLAGVSDGDALRRAAQAAEAAAARASIVVSNEVGMGIVPERELGRRYRDLLGSVNVVFAEAAGRLLLVHAGRAVELEAVE
jgi:adenosylcobinamide kinase/adenosylcobinamide-phosphate guanylyltransferase